MKTSLLLAVSCGIALAQVVKAEDQDQVKQPKTRANVTQPSRPVTRVGPSINQTKGQVNRYHPKVMSPGPVQKRTTIPNTVRLQPPSMIQSAPDAPLRNRTRRNWRNDDNQNTTLRNRNWQERNNQNTTLRNRNWQERSKQNTTQRNRNWRNTNPNIFSWAEARRRQHHNHHDRNWWRSRYARFALFGTGYYFWDNGYWFPAYGYDSGYNTYAYNEPIYGYNDLDPGQVVARVQTELQELGYYRDAIDGDMGPITRAAIADYQRDNGLTITAAIDGPTLQSLGLD